MTEKYFSCPFEKKDDLNICNNIPNVDYKDQWHRGGTGYIDGVRPKDDAFSNGPLVKFIDNFHRSAIAIKYTTSCPSSTEENNYEYAVTAFQRYTDDSGLWVFGGHFANQRATNIGKVDLQWLESLVVNGQETFNSYDYDSDSSQQCTITLGGMQELPSSVDL